MKTIEEIREQIQDLFKKRTVIPEGVKEHEKDSWAVYCEGGISALYWVLEEKNPMKIPPGGS